jgi:hypothetical protein
MIVANAGSLTGQLADKITRQHTFAGKLREMPLHHLVWVLRGITDPGTKKWHSLTRISKYVGDKHGWAAKVIENKTKVGRNNENTTLRDIIIGLANFGQLYRDEMEWALEDHDRLVAEVKKRYEDERQAKRQKPAIRAAAEEVLHPRDRRSAQPQRNSVADPEPSPAQESAADAIVEAFADVYVDRRAEPTPAIDSPAEPARVTDVNALATYDGIIRRMHGHTVAMYSFIEELDELHKVAPAVLRPGIEAKSAAVMAAVSALEPLTKE